MNDEITYPTPDEQRESPAYPQSRFVLLLAVVAFLVLSMGIAERAASRDGEGGGFSEKTLQADLAVKISYAYGEWAPLASEAQRRRIQDFQRKELRLAADMLYSEIGEDPSRDSLRKLIIVGSRADREGALPKLERLLARDGKPTAEIEMWRAVYLSDKPLSTSQAKQYQLMIRDVELGWYRYPALADLYERAGMKADASRERTDANVSALRTVVSFLAIVAVIFMLGLSGLALIPLYINAKRSGRLVARESRDDLTPSQRSWVSGYLLETFVVYLFVVIGTQLAALPLLFVSEENGSGVLLTAGVYVLSGIISAIYLRHRLRMAGWSWEVVGLGSANRWRDVAWGIGGYASALPLVLVAGLISRLLDKYVTTPSNPVIPLFAESSGVVDRIILLVLVSVAAPFFEELFFRGALYHSLGAKWGVVMGIAASAVVFGLLHPLPLDFLPIFALGSVFGILTYERGSLLPSMVAHAMNNTAAFVLLSILVGA